MIYLIQDTDDELFLMSEKPVNSEIILGEYKTIVEAELALCREINLRGE